MAAHLERPAFIQAPNVKILINIGAGLDIPTGHFLIGAHGESILNGGLAQTTGMVGIGNSFKSTCCHYMMLSAADRIMQSTPTNMFTYDTEINIDENRLRLFTQRFPSFANVDIFEEAIWNVTDKTVYYANEMYEIMKSYLKDKRENKDKLLVETPFLMRDKVTKIKIAPPTFGEVDSFSEFETEDVAKIQDQNELGDSGGNTVHMRAGLAKTRFLMDLPTLCGSANHYMLMTAHVGKEMMMASGPIPTPPTKKLQFLKNGDKVKGVTDKFFFLMGNCWHAYSTAPLINQGTKGPEYPRNPTDNSQGDTDLNIVHLRQIRSKWGLTGVTHELVVSQIEGVLPELTEFHYIKSADRYGLSGSQQHYALDIYPDVKLSRTTIRSKIESDKRLRRALNITCEMCQMKTHWRTWVDNELFCTPKELYDDLIALGYNWDQLLDTRGWWTINNDDHPIKFLSTMDLLRMRKGLYRPYWMDADTPK